MKEAKAAPAPVFEWEQDIPLECRNCTNVRYVIPAVCEAYRARRELEDIRLAVREAMRIGGARTGQSVEDWIKERCGDDICEEEQKRSLRKGSGRS